MNGLVAVAVVLATAAAGCFAAAAVLQHDAVRRLGAAHAWRSRRWWTGGIAAAAGATGHATALVLAPLAVVQPLGVLAVPLGVLFERRTSARAGGVTAVALAVSGVVGGVALFTLATTAAAGTPRPPADPWRVLAVVLLVALPAVALAALSVIPARFLPRLSALHDGDRTVPGEGRARRGGVRAGLGRPADRHRGRLPRPGRVAAPGSPWSACSRWRQAGSACSPRSAAALRLWSWRA